MVNINTAVLGRYSSSDRRGHPLESSIYTFIRQPLTLEGFSGKYMNGDEKFKSR